ncbi:MAG: hypothetical protein U9R37_03705 [Campylobacterota bacterium]|nr:hypothetical protein [Campylobacterota bacterium]
MLSKFIFTSFIKDSLVIASSISFKLESIRKPTNRLNPSVKDADAIFAPAIEVAQIANAPSQLLSFRLNKFFVLLILLLQSLFIHFF